MAPTEEGKGTGALYWQILGGKVVLQNISLLAEKEGGVRIDMRRTSNNGRKSPRSAEKKKAETSGGSVIFFTGRKCELKCHKGGDLVRFLHSSAPREGKSGKNFRGSKKRTSSNHAYRGAERVDILFA